MNIERKSWKNIFPCVSFLSTSPDPPSSPFSASIPILKMEFLISLIENREKLKINKEFPSFVFQVENFPFTTSSGRGEKVQVVITSSSPQNICFLIKSQQFNRGIFQPFPCDCYRVEILFIRLEVRLFNLIYFSG